LHYRICKSVYISIEVVNKMIKSVYISAKMWKGEVLLGKTASENATAKLPKSFQFPIINVAIIQEWTGFTQQGAQKVIDRFVDLGILELKDENKTYGRSFIYRRYVDIFMDK
jgi:hypothetical protein